MDENTNELIRFFKEGGFPEMSLEGDARKDYKKQPLLLIPIILCCMHIPFLIFSALLLYIEAEIYNFIYMLLRVDKK